MALSFSLPRIMVSIIVVAAVGCLWCASADGLWEIRPKPTPSAGSRFSVLHNWQETYSTAAAVPALPALSLSDVLLKTMGILRDGADWPGVLMGSLFSRPHATAVFLVDGASRDMAIGPLSQLSYEVDQSGLTGCAAEDSSLLFSGDSLSNHLARLFDGRPQTWSISADPQAAFAASVDGAFTSESQVGNLVTSIMSGTDGQLISELGLGQVAEKFDLTSRVDATFLAELSAMKQAVEKVRELKSVLHDGAPDVYIFTVSTLRALEEVYGAGSTKTKMAAQMVQQLIKQLSHDLVEAYGGEILVQALVLEWDYPEFSTESPELADAYAVLEPYLTVSKHEFVAHLPHISIDSSAALAADAGYLCDRLRAVLRTHFQATCPDRKMWTPPNRVLRKVTEGAASSNSTIANVAGTRSDNFAPVTLIIIFLVVSLGLALFAISWMMWTIDPGRDSIIYRQVSDPTDTVRMQ